jgi:hypothetical protein
MLLESVCSDVTPEQRKIIEGIYSHLEPLIEVSLNPNQINDLFTSTEKTATTAGGNRTGLGSTVDAAKTTGKAALAAAKKADELMTKAGEWAQNTTPVKFFDKKFEELKTNIAAKLGGSNSKIVTAVEAIGEYAKKNPQKTALAVGVLTFIAGLAAGPVGAAIAGQVIRGTVGLMKGESLSTAVGKGIKTALVGAGLSWLSGVAIKDIASAFKESMPVLKLIPGFKSLTYMSWDVNLNGQHLINFSKVPMTAEDAAKIRALMKEADIGMKDLLNIDTAKVVNALTKIDQILDDPARLAGVKNIIDSNAAIEKAQSAAAEAFNLAKKQIEAQHDKIDVIAKAIAGATGGVIQGAVAGASTTKESDEWNEATVGLLHESIFSTIQKKLSQAGTNLTTKITADKLNKVWVAAGSPSDSKEIVKILRTAGASDKIIADAMTAIGISPRNIKASLALPKEPTEPKPVPFTSGVDELDTEAEKIFRKSGKKAFLAWWDAKVIELEKAAADEEKKKKAALNPVIGNTISAQGKKYVYSGKGVWKILSVSGKPGAAVAPEIAAQLTDKFKKKKVKASTTPTAEGILEFVTIGGISAGAVANSISPIGGGPLMPVIRRMPRGQSFFGPAMGEPKKSRKKLRKKA